MGHHSIRTQGLKDFSEDNNSSNLNSSISKLPT